MTTEAELVLMTLTREELDDCGRYLGLLDAAWRQMTRPDRSSSGLRTDGPWHLIGAMRLALLRERATRYGADPWYAGQPTTGHPAGRLIELYERRLELNVEYRFSPRLTEAGVLEQGCVICGKPKPLTMAFFGRPDGVWGDICHGCNVIDRAKIVEALEGPPAVIPAPDPGLAEDVDVEAFL